MRPPPSNRFLVPVDEPWTPLEEIQTAGHETRIGTYRATRVSNVMTERVAWLWPGRLPLGKLVVLDGDPALGKSTLMLDLAARVSTGSPMPDGARLLGPSGVVLLSAEDGIGDTIRPRLEAAGAELARVVVLESVNANGRERPPSLPADLDTLEKVIIEEDAKLVVVDVLSAFLHGSVDSYRDQDVRGALMPLARLGERTGTVIVVIRHLSKSGGNNALYRGGGSIGIIGAARAAMLVAPDPDDEGRSILAMSKSNLAPMPDALAFRLVEDELRKVARVRWEGATTHKAGDLLAAAGDEDGPTAGSAAEEFLLDLLADGPVAAKRGQAEARDAGIAERTMKRAKKKLGVRSEKLGRPGEVGQSWCWVLPKGAEQGHTNERHPSAPFEQEDDR